MKEPILFKNHLALFDATSPLYSPVNPTADDFTVSANETKARVKYWNELAASSSPELANFTLHAKANSKLEYVLFQNLPEGAEGIARVKIMAEKGASVQLTVIQQGAARSNIDVRAECLGEGADIQIRGLQNAKDAQKFAINVHAVHSVPHTRSDLIVYCVARDTSQSIFNGLVTIEKNAHHTEAYQKNKNLLLSEKATIDTFPKLFIANDEVKCAHGSSTSTLEPEQFIYLQSRGINQVDAENMLTSGFLNQALSWISLDDEKIKLAKALNVYEEGAWDE